MDYRRFVWRRKFGEGWFASMFLVPVEVINRDFDMQEIEDFVFNTPDPNAQDAPPKP